jgi:hypothetical protein
MQELNRKRRLPHLAYEGKQLLYKPMELSYDH